MSAKLNIMKVCMVNKIITCMRDYDLLGLAKLRSDRVCKINLYSDVGQVQIIRRTKRIKNTYNSVPIRNHLTAGRYHNFVALNYFALFWRQAENLFGRMSKFQKVFFGEQNCLLNFG